MTCCMLRGDVLDSSVFLLLLSASAGDAGAEYLANADGGPGLSPKEGTQFPVSAAGSGFLASLFYAEKHWSYRHRHGSTCRIRRSTLHRGSLRFHTMLSRYLGAK